MNSAARGEPRNPRTEPAVSRRADDSSRPEDVRYFPTITRKHSMRLFPLLLLISLTTAASVAAQQNCGAPQGGVWPAGAADGGACLVGRTEAVLNEPGLRIVLPDGFRVVVAADVPRIDWSADQLSFGKDATLDVSAIPAALPKPTTPPAPGGQPSYFQPGRPGAEGGVGVNGADGRDVRIVVNKVAAGGSLWIRTDGAPGGPGGAGGPGGLAGGTRCESPSRHGANGGTGGTGGAGGRGGRTATVTIIDKSLPAGFVKKPVAGPAEGTCGPSSRPPSATGDAGIIVWGNPGCGGPGGEGGAGGPPDCSVPRRGPCHQGLFTNYFVHCGKQGATGSGGPSGAPGSLGAVVIKAP